MHCMRVEGACRGPGGGGGGGEGLTGTEVPFGGGKAPERDSATVCTAGRVHQSVPPADA